MQKYEQDNVKSGFFYNIIDTFDLLGYSLIYQMLIFFQASFTAIGIFQANDIISGVIETNISTNVILFKLATILGLIVMLILSSIATHYLVKYNAKKAKRFSVLKSIEKSDKEEFGAETAMFLG